MPIIVTITNAPESVNVAESTKTFDEQGGTLGRGADNAWILDDPERFLSSCHCRLSSEGGQFYITDLSTNGTFFNGSVNPMGKGVKLPINDGNVFVLGDYEFSVSINSAMQGAYSDPFASSAPSMGQIPDDDLFSPASSNDGFGQGDSSPFGGGVVSSSDSDSLFSTTTEETDPLAALDKAQGGAQSSSQDISGGFDNLSSAGSNPFQASPVSDPFGGPTHSDQADPLAQQVSWPNSISEHSGGGIPDDWDDDLMSSSSPAPQTPSPNSAPVQPSMPLTQPPVVPKPAQQASAPAPHVATKPIEPPIEPQIEKPVQQQPVGQMDSQTTAAMLAQIKANKKIQAELEILKEQMKAQQRGGQPQAEVSVDTTLIEAMGLQNKNLVDAEIIQINQLVGEVVREMISGMMQVLGSRSTIKNEFRMNVTTIQPVENNPLKFSANVDDALENMFIKQGNAYKKPVAAVKESFDGIAEHQVAILAGIRAAFKGVIERFDPVLLERRFVKQKKSGIIPASQKAKNWELYLEYYDELAGDIDNSFQFLFGDEFVQAYEDQLQKLTVARKSQNIKTNK